MWKAILLSLLLLVGIEWAQAPTPNSTAGDVSIVDTGLLGPYTAAQIQGMFAAPIVLVAAPGTGKAIKVVTGVINVVYGGTPITAGGNIALFYGTTSPPLATNQAAGAQGATAFTGLSANSLFAIPASALTVPTYLNQSLTLSNLTQPFAGGTNSAFYVEVKYYIQSGVQ